jgi:glycosyltransferase involved in cell wall biosynthesis
VHRNLDVRGGAEKVVEVLVTGLHKAGDDVFVVSMKRPSTHEGLMHFFDQHPDRLYLFREREIPFGDQANPLHRHFHAMQRLALLRRILRRMEFDVAFSRTESVSGTVLAFMAIPSPRILYPTCPLIPQTPYSLIMRLMLWRSPVDIVLPCKSYLNEFLPQFRYNPKILYPPYEDDFFRPNPGAQKENSICMTGRITPGKKYETGLLAAKKIVRQRTDVTLKIVGEVRDEKDPYYRYLRSLIGRLGLERNVELAACGEKQALRQAYQESLVYWNLSIGYWGITNIEAIGCGAFPVLSPNLSEVVEATGLGMVAHSVDDLVIKTLDLLRNPSRTRMLAMEACKRFPTRFGVDQFVRRFRSIFLARQCSQEAAAGSF